MQCTQTIPLRLEHSSCSQEVPLEWPPSYNEQISLHENNWPQCSKAWSYQVQGNNKLFPFSCFTSASWTQCNGTWRLPILIYQNLIQSSVKIWEITDICTLLYEKMKPYCLNLILTLNLISAFGFMPLFLSRLKPYKCLSCDDSLAILLRASTVELYIFLLLSLSKLCISN